MFPKVVKWQEFKKVIFFVTDTRVISAGLCLSLIDTEENRDFEKALSYFLKSTKSNVKYRIISKTNFNNQITGEHLRVEDISQLGKTEHTLLLLAEKKLDSVAKNLAFVFNRAFKHDDYLEKSMNDILEALPVDQLKRLNLQVEPMTKVELEDLFPNCQYRLQQRPYGLDFGHSLKALLKLIKLGNYELSYHSLCELREQLPLPYEIHISFTKISPARSQMILNRKSKQEETGSGQVSFRKYSESQEALEEVELHGTNLFEFEFHVVLSQSNEQWLRAAISDSLSALQPLGEFNVESVGAINSYISLIPGGKTHVPLIEKDEVLPVYIPLCVRGASRSINYQKRSFAYHRTDQSIDELDIFCKDYNNFCATVIGSPGRGKSVFVNILLRCLANDPEVRIIVVDVKGSHTRTIKNIGGRVHHVTLKSPSGINPLLFLIGSDNETKEVVLGFLEQLMLDEDETHLPTEQHYKLEKALIEYSKSSKALYTIDDFLAKSSDLPRKEYLMRFSENSLKNEVFRSTEQTVESRIHYYNFEEVMTATNKTLARGVMASVMADFSYQLMHKDRGEKLVFIADETPFFVKECFSSFRLLNKNVRKLNGSLILVAQSSTDLVINHDTSLLDNSDLKVLFSIDGKASEFKERMHLNSNEMEILSGLRTRMGKYSQFLIKDPVASKVGFLILSPKEYFNSTTHGDEVSLIEKIKSVLPELSEDKIIKLLSLN